MGHGIAQVFALAGHEVTITDALAVSLDTVKSRISTNLRDLGDDPRTVERVRPIADLAEAVKGSDYVVEAVSEDLSLKQKLFAEIELHVRPNTILASNTSDIPITNWRAAPQARFTIGEIRHRAAVEVIGTLDRSTPSSGP